MPRYNRLRSSREKEMEHRSHDCHLFQADDPFSKSSSTVSSGMEASKVGGGRFGATLQRVSSYTQSRLPEPGAGWEEPTVQESALSSHRAFSARDAGSWAAAVQRTAWMRDPGDYGTNFEALRNINGSSYRVNGGISCFETSSNGRGKGGGVYGEENDAPPVFMSSRDTHHMPASLGAAVQRALSLREGQMAAASARAARQPQQSFRRAQEGAEYSSPVYEHRGRGGGGRSGQRLQTQSMRYDRITIHPDDDDYSHRSSSVGEKDRMTSGAVLQRVASLREQGQSPGPAPPPSRLHCMVEQPSPFLACATCGRGLALAGPDKVRLCQACSRPTPASKWTDPAIVIGSTTASALPPKKKNSLLRACRRLLGLHRPTTT